MNKPRLSFFIKIGILHIILLALFGCAQLGQGLEKPSVKLENIALANNNFLSPRFKLSLRITNPNSIALPIVGISYVVSIEGVELFDGVKNDIPQIAAYGDTLIDVELGTNLLKAASLLSILKDRTDNNVNYGMSAKIDLSGVLPSFNVQESGVVSLPQ